MLYNLQAIGLPSCVTHQIYKWWIMQESVVVREDWQCLSNSIVPHNYKHHLNSWTSHCLILIWKLYSLTARDWRKYTHARAHTYTHTHTHFSICTVHYVYYRYEAEAVRQCLVEGKTECDAMPLDETLVIAETMDTILQQLGVKY